MKAVLPRNVCISKGWKVEHRSGVEDIEILNLLEARKKPRIFNNPFIEYVAESSGKWATRSERFEERAIAKHGLNLPPLIFLERKAAPARSQNPLNPDGELFTGMLHLRFPITHAASVDLGSLM
ncbi:MAG: hypothetical protein IOD12_12760 [Silvanigrellales bacterium]|nr:hypothetical protein [Silvanigrellales bacterium]